MSFNRQLPNVFTYAGNPNGNVAGNAAGSSGGLPPDFAWDSTNNILYSCTTTGSSSTAVWTKVSSYGGTNPYIGAAGGTVDAITATIYGASTADQQVVYVVATGANTITTPTFKLNSDALHTITTRGGQACSVADIPGAGFMLILEYNAANTRWELCNPAAAPVGANSILNTMLAQAPAYTVKGNNTSGTANEGDLTVDQIVAMNAQIQRVAQYWFS